LQDILEGHHRIRLRLSLAKLLPRHPQLDHHPLLPFVIDQEMAMKKKAAVFLKMRARDGLAPGSVGIEGRSQENNVLAVERAVALANGHCCLPRVVPHRSEAIRFGIETGDPGPGALGSVRIEEGEIRLQKLAVLDHVLLARAFCHDRLPVRREEGLDDVPVARELRQQLLAGARPVRRLVLIVSLLPGRRSGNEQSRKKPFFHGRRMILLSDNQRNSR
jgi:hypothetical protein